MRLKHKHYMTLVALRGDEAISLKCSSSYYGLTKISFCASLVSDHIKRK